MHVKYWEEYVAEYTEEVETYIKEILFKEEQFIQY